MILEEFKMNKNVGKIDRLIRIIIGIIIIALGIYFKSWWGIIGLLPIFTGTIRFCPLYVPFKINTP
jgi:sulfite exporter TauE/SafE